jgi:hypothetical protein
MAFAPEMEEATCSQRFRFGGQSDHGERQTHKKPLFPTDLQNLMPRLGVCDPSDCRVAFISRGSAASKELLAASVASDANAVRWWHCRHSTRLVTNRQPMAKSNALDGRPISYMRALQACCSGRSLDTKQPLVAWIERASSCSL